MIRYFGPLFALALLMATPASAQIELIETEEEAVSGEPEMIGMLYLVVALHEFCEVQIPAAAIDAIGHDAKRLEERMGLTPEQSETSYQAVFKATSESTPECSEEQLRSALGTYANGVSPFGGL